MVSRAGMSSGGNGTTTNTSTTGTQTTNTSTTGTSTGRSNSSGVQTTTSDIQNMTGTALGALDSLIMGLSGSMGISAGAGGGAGSASIGGGGKKKSGSNAAANEATSQWRAQIQKLNDLANTYSKDAAFKDSDVAVQGALAKALEASMPTITAGIQSAGTSGSAMSALLTQKAAEDAAYNAAQVGVNAAIQYGNIAANSLASAGTLIEGGDPTMNALVNALGIAKGAVQEGTTKTKTDQLSSQSSTQNSNTVQTTAGTQNTNQTTTPTGGTQGGTATTTNTATGNTATPNYAGNQQAWYTPSSYRNATYVQKGTSYSQFG